MDWLMEIVVIGLIVAVAGLLWKNYRTKKEAEWFAGKVETALDAIVTGKEWNLEEELEDSLWGRTGTQLEKVEQVFRKKEEESLREKESVKGLISDISHQIRTPVANIKLYMELLEGENVSRDVQEFLKQYQGDMLMVTHSRDEAFRFCNELMLLKDGKTLIFGDTRKLFEQPQLLEAARLTGCKNSSRIERMGEHQVFALDWGISLRTEQKVEPDMTHIAIRGHWIQPSEQNGENCVAFEAAEYVETTFEHQYLFRNKGAAESGTLWWMCQKKNFQETAKDNIPKYLYFPPEHVMLLKK